MNIGVVLQLSTLFLQLELFKQFSNAAPSQSKRPLSPGDSCSQPGFGEGICSFECLEYRQQINRGLRLKMCNHHGTQPLLCCPTSFEQFKEQFVWVLTATRNGFHVQKIPEPPRELAATSRAALDNLMKNKKKMYEEQEKYDDLPFGRASRKMCKTYSRVCKSLDFIIGGEPVKMKEYGHEAAIAFGANKTENELEWRCGGTIISEYYILTAAHCTFNFAWGPASWVRVGDLDLKTDGDGKPRNYKISRRISHSLYNSSSFYHDIALLELEEPIEFNDYVRPACLSMEEKVEGTFDYGIATGWGHTDAGTILKTTEGRSNLLMKVEVPIVEYKKCNPYYANFLGLKKGIVPEYQLCAGAVGKDTCQGDSGGPLFIRSSKHNCLYSIVGITSCGLGCGTKAPGVYTRVYNYISWIENIVWSEDVKSLPPLKRKPPPNLYLYNFN